MNDELLAGPAGPSPEGDRPLDDAAPATPPRSRTRARRRVALYSVIGVVVLFGLVQLVPYRVDNPPTKQEPTWDSADTRRLAAVACFDCHSNETHTYWFEDVAPLSWWITNHVKDGREALNFSDCTRGGGENEASETVREGSMPPNYYTWFGLHSKADLTTAERRQLAAGLSATLRGWNCGNGGD
jgi:mono/diheme cytochrome c family protein